MKTFIIPQKMSNTGSIHDIASDLYDREIKFPAGSRYAVVLASYYGGKGYTTHRTADGAIYKCKQLKCSRSIIDLNGTEYCIFGDKLMKLGN